MSPDSSEAHWLMGKIEKYYTFICQVYDIIQIETRGIISKNAILQMIFKAVNDITDSDGLILTLPIFNGYPHIITRSLLSAS